MRIIATGFQLSMKFFCLLLLLCAVPALLAAEAPVQIPLSEAQQKFRGELASKVQNLGKEKRRRLRGSRRLAVFRGRISPSLARPVLGRRSAESEPLA